MEESVKRTNWIVQLSMLQKATMEGIIHFVDKDNAYGIPLAYKCLALYVNNDLLPSPPKTTDELLSLTFDDPEVVPLAYQATEPYYHALWMHGANGGLFDSEGSPQINAPENITGLEFLLELQQKNLLPEEPTSALVSQLFNQSQAAMVINGTLLWTR